MLLWRLFGRVAATAIVLGGERGEVWENRSVPCIKQQNKGVLTVSVGVAGSVIKVLDLDGGRADVGQVLLDEVKDAVDGDVRVCKQSSLILELLRTVRRRSLLL